MSKSEHNDRGREEANDRNGLFGDETPTLFSLRPKTSHPAELGSPIGDNLHELTDKQITKLLQLKFHNSPILLIRQLSEDLSAKESELILLRKEKFQREQELYRLCTEYGNLSRMEIDKKLNALRIEGNVQKVVSELIDTAINDLAQRPNPPPETHQVERRTRHLRRSDSPKVPSIMVGDLLKPYETDSERIDKRSSHWYRWLSPSEDTLPSESSANLDNRYRSPSLSNSREMKPRRAPVELESMVLEKDRIVASPDLNIDSHGFYNDTSVARPPLRTPDLAKSTELTFAEATISTFKNSKSIDALKHLGELHDAKSEEHVRRWDTFMRDINRGIAQQQGGGHETFGMKAMNMRRQDPGLAKFFISSEEERNEQSRQFKTLRRLVSGGGIPRKYRNELWFELSGAKNKEVPGEYTRLVGVSRSSKDPQLQTQIDQINLDLHRTLPSNMYFNDMATSQPGPHFYKLQSILYAFVAYKPHVGYSQGMNKIVGNLLLGVSEGNHNGSRRLTEEDVFWIFVSFTEDCLPRYGDLDYFHRDSLAHIQQDVEIVQLRYFPKYVPTLHRHLQDLGVEVLVILLGWWVGVFTDNFASVELWFKLLDSILITENVDVKFVSISLSFFKLHEKTLLELTNAEDIYKLMSNLRLAQFNQTNMRFNDLIAANNDFERAMSASELAGFRQGLGK